MKNSEANDPLKETKNKEQKTETRHPKPPGEEKENDTADHVDPPVSATEPISSEAVVELPESHTSEAIADTAPPAKEPATETSEPEPAPAASESKPEPEQLIDDSEEQQKNASYDDDVDIEDREPEEEGINYGLLSKEDLVKLMKEKLDNPGKGNIRKEVEDIKQVFYEKVAAVLEEKKKHFLDEGGNLEDFKPAGEPVETAMKELLYKYKGLRAEFTRQLEKTKKENLVKKQEVLDGFRMLMEGQETFELTFRKFKDLQKQWFSAGVVPHQYLKDLWDSYNYFVEKFNDYVRINRDLRALDLKKNMELKVQLCERTEELDKEPNIVHAFKSLQKNHTRWREIGPVPRENRDEIWDRFKLATSVINKKHQEYHSRLKESLHENLEKKINLCEKIENIAATVYETHGAWVDRTNHVLEIQKTWKSIGYAPKKDNNVIYSRFRTACDLFFGNKAKFYAAAYEDQKDNLKLKLEIAEKAESLSSSQEWKETTNELIMLQKRWKEIGPVPRRDSDKLWKRFRAACDTFFNNKSKYFEDIDSTFDENLKSKEILVAEMDAFSASDDRKKNLEALNVFQTRFNAIGYVPSGKKEWIKDQFRLAQDRLLEKTGMDESQRSIFRFRYRIAGMANAPRSDMKLNFERDKLVNKLQQLRNDMSVWENNIGFFKQSDSSEETIHGFKEKIDAAHERIEVLEKKIRILDDMENEN
ncbi:MAG: DUF349 domain-containing protein [Bacteroidales bacterium]|nr:DUF349 domain-containing protein [Bacteroidales bacterium]